VLDALSRSSNPATATAGTEIGDADDARAMDLNGLDNLLGFNLGIAYASLSFDLDPALRLLDLTPKQTSILWLVEVNEGITQSQLARLFRMRRATIHQMISSLSRKEFLSLKQDSSDRRIQGLFITETGKVELAKARSIVNTIEQNFANTLTDAEFRMAIELLQKIQRGKSHAQ
jgi:DNA-binding MarR family transcriptional regulator